MDSVVEGWSGSHPTPRSTTSSTSDLSSNRQKRVKIGETDWTDPFSVANWEEGINSAKFGTVTKEIQALLARRAEMMKPFLQNVYMNANHEKEALPAHHPTHNLDDTIVANSTAAQPLIIIDSDDEEPKNQRLSQPHQNIVVKKPTEEVPLKHCLEEDYAQGQNHQILMLGDGSLSKESSSKNDTKGVHIGKEDECTKDKGEFTGAQGETLIEGDASLGDESKSKKDAKRLYSSKENGSKKGKGVYVGVEDMEIEEENQQTDVNFDGLADIWKEMNFGLECSKDIAPQLASNESTRDGDEDCEHSFILKDDLGYVCRICGVISKSIETIIEYQHPKNTRSTRTYYRESRTAKDGEVAKFHPDGTRVAQNDFSLAEIHAHPRHKKQMKPHQVEGFNFLLSNLVTENPGGCILAHAPGSGKTFMLISFIQSFMAKYPLAKPLVILPRGILPTWKKEFKRWQIEEDLPLFDFYSVKADSRSQQLDVLNQWIEQRSILFLGYKQFSSIVCDSDTGNISTRCQDILLTYPSILILDEGHTPRNQDTDVLTSLEKVQTPRKVVLSGTLYQNHVKEVFNILNLVRPRFLKLETSKSIKKRILSRVPISSNKNLTKKGTDNEFYDLVELTLVKDDNFKRKVTVIEDLREMTSKVLHYYKGDFLDELPGLVDYTVFLNLSAKQKKDVSTLKKSANKFKMISDGSAIYVHPELKSLTKNTNTTVRERADEGKIDELLDKLNLQDGVKAKFFLNLLSLCESSGEKLLVFGQYLLPLKFLERLAMKVKGWSSGKEIFMITGDSDSDQREISMDRFNSSSDARVFFGSIKACGEGISLVGASRIIILDVHLNPSVTRQAIGRAFRPGQERKVYTYRLVAANAPEEEDHYTCFRKESISKMWFEWNEYCGHNEFEMEKVDISDCGDQFLETSRLNEDIVALYKR